MQTDNEYSGVIDGIFSQISEQEMQYEELLHTVSEEINRIMCKEGLTKAELADKMGVSRPYITKLLRGTNVSLQTLAKVASALGYKTCISMIPKHWEARVFAVSPVNKQRQGDRRARFADGFREKEGYAYAGVATR
ncbi:helix-turn-helix domain-containing protein [Desulfohalobium retbaense]|uniref:Transcriptional regulator, XRE family n=1 Tax=Desulfohalobium retbaense (strain ATCC 49708 / DSM 5692 / JCM 16813 / HR100) TaxID=485915 RepID=C8X065_DESRD|nr:helix-turn-helix domain-containing protein [Desulfohalobium retbaense]ACV67690.1 transcriptional regulator, XRE family [Desulfohalobium retbaense DSM 5692]